MMLYHGDCLEVMPTLPDKSIDMILCDLPYGITKNEWDNVIPFESLWIQYKRLIKPNSAILLFGIEPFSTKLRTSNQSWYRHEWYWNKNNSAGFATVKHRPFSIIENIIVFGNGRVNYYPQMEIRGKERLKGGYSKSDNYGLEPKKSEIKSNLYYPKNLINIGNANNKSKLHPTQKPVELLEYLIKTYTLEGEVVLDNCMGSGSTGEACINLGREFIGIETEKKYFDIAGKRLNYE